MSPSVCTLLCKTSQHSPALRERSIDACMKQQVDVEQHFCSATLSWTWQVVAQHLDMPVLFWFILLEMSNITVHTECLRWQSTRMFAWYLM